MFLIKYFFIGLIIVATFVSGALGLMGENWFPKLGYVILFLLGFLVLNLIAKIAWRFLFLILGVFFIIYTLSYFEIIEFSLPSLTKAAKEVYEEVK